MLKKEDVFIYLIIIIILLVCLRIYYDSDYFNLTCVISDVDVLEKEINYILQPIYWLL
jgi:hypothetical protein